MIRKASHPKITCLAPSSQGYARVDTRYKNSAVRLSRRGPGREGASTPRYRDYFQAIIRVLSGNGLIALVNATCDHARRDICLADIDEIKIYAEKHGSDYHPARIEVVSGGGGVFFVMNVAITERGRARLCNEFDVLRHLHTKYAFSFLPKAYFQCETPVARPHGKGLTSMSMFLADWFEGYHEFHLSLERQTGAQKIVLWEGNRGARYIDDPQAKEIYAQAAKIMTLYYDLRTFEQIFPWHHAAGDFVARTDKDALDVKLVAARQYACMVRPCKEVSSHEALLLFLLNLSLRMRLDRLDGVGGVAWAGDGCMDATLQGFARALEMQEQKGTAGRGTVAEFFRFCGSVSMDSLGNRFEALVGACDPAAPDIPVIRANLQGHVVKFFAALQSIAV